MTAQIIDGKAFATDLRAKIAEKVAVIKETYQVTPGLAVVLVGEDPASQVYVRNKERQTEEAGMRSFAYKLPADTTQETLLAKVDELNHNPEVHGILVQLPLPAGINEEAVIEAIHPEKDVDGFHVINTGRLATGQDGLVPCTPSGCLLLLKETLGDLSGRDAVVIGRSNIVGKPMAQLLLNENCTVTIVHSRTKNVKEKVQQADIVVAAVGRPKMVKADWLKEGVTVIDVGINRMEPKQAGGKAQLVGDVDFNDALQKAQAITPVPGGVGPMTIACLLRNTLVACCKQAGLAIQEI